MSRTGFVYHDKFVNHLTGEGHPERPARVTSLIQYLERRDELSKLVGLAAEPCDRKWIRQIHPDTYIQRVEEACGPELAYLDPDTVVSEASFAVACLAAGSVIAACRAVMDGEIDNAFCAVRPPGHHAEPERAMGFCLLNNVAIAAKYLQVQHGIDKVLIIDWDVHHGNGTQSAFYRDPSVFFSSIHEYPLYPWTGPEYETGAESGEGTTLNVPLQAGSGDAEYARILAERVLPAARDFDPDFVLISAGFDAHLADPLANMEVSEVGFREMTQAVRSVAEDCCEGRLVSILEGGYNLEALARSVESHLEALLE